MNRSLSRTESYRSPHAKPLEEVADTLARSWGVQSPREVFHPGFPPRIATLLLAATPSPLTFPSCPTWWETIPFGQWCSVFLKRELSSMPAETSARAVLSARVKSLALASLVRALARLRQLSRALLRFAQRLTTTIDRSFLAIWPELAKFHANRSTSGHSRSARDRAQANPNTLRPFSCAANPATRAPNNQPAPNP
jgi:hypothetical protein